MGRADGQTGMLATVWLALALSLCVALAPQLAFADDIVVEQATEDESVPGVDESTSGEVPSEPDGQEPTPDIAEPKSEESKSEGQESGEPEASEAADAQESPDGGDQQPSGPVVSDEEAPAEEEEAGTADQPADVDSRADETPQAEAPLVALEPQATRQDLLDNALWIKQPSSGWCTLDSAVMMLRRAAILNGTPSWKTITEASVKPVAWTTQGLRWSFTYQGISVACASLRTSNEATLIRLLAEHPEGVVIYNYAHAVLLTDYTDGVLYCADPAYGTRIKLSAASLNVRANNIKQYWYVTSHVDEPEDPDALQGSLVQYRTHVQNVGWQSWRADGGVSGTSGRSLRLEGINVKLGSLPYKGGVRYRTHVQNIGWQDWVSNGEMSGTSGKSLRLEAIQIELTGELAKHYDVYYRVHAQNIGWMGWAKNGEQAGTATYSYRLEAIQVALVKKGSAAPGTTYQGVTQATGEAFRQRTLQYRTHVQNVGWQEWSFDGAMAGTSGRSLRLEGIEIKLASHPYAGSVRYRTHVQDYGWQGWMSDGAMSGTSGKAKRLEAIQIELTGEMATHYDVWYRVHCQNIGWMGWAKNGGQSGTAGYAYRLEGIEVKLVEKGGPAPGTTANAFQQKA